MLSRIHLATLITCVVSLEPTSRGGFLTQNEEMCLKFGLNPYFDPELVIGPPWRIYYTWNLRMDDRCIDMTFKNITAWTVNRFWTDMSEYMETQPAWDAAMLFMTMGQANHQMLLFADQGPSGKVHGVPNVIRDASLVTLKNSVPLLQFQMKLLHGGKYLVMMDCQVGVVSLSARTAGAPPYRAEIESVAAELGIGDGFPACTKHLHKHEQTVNRYREDMSEYLKSQPDWGSALMFVRVGMNRQLLLFPDRGPAGRVLGAPNVSRDRRIAPARKAVPFMPFQFKLLRGGKYLVMVDCSLGVVSLSARVGEALLEPELAAASAELGIGEGRPACVKLE